MKANECFIDGAQWYRSRLKEMKGEKKDEVRGVPFDEPRCFNPDHGICDDDK